MNLATFITLASDQEWLQQRRITIFAGAVYPMLWYMHIRSLYKKVPNTHYQMIDLQYTQLNQLSALLFSTFLGQRVHYWLSNVHELGLREQEHILTLVSSYTGDNSITCFTSHTALVADERFAAHSIEVPAEIDHETAHSVLQFLLHDSTITLEKYVEKLRFHRQTVSLDAIYLLAHYIQVTRDCSAQFINQWFSIIITPNHSLFDLSKHFFARQREQFFQMWQHIAEFYGELFWIAFWSDLLWRAYHFVRLSQAGAHADAKKIAQRLPFSFMQHGWKRVSAESLQEAMYTIYEVDHRIKHGSLQGYLLLECMYAKFLAQ